MTSRRMSAVVYITICLSLFCNINAESTERTMTQDGLNTSETKTIFSSNSAGTTLSSTLDVTNSSATVTDTKSLNATELSLTSTSRLSPPSTSRLSPPSTSRLSPPSTSTSTTQTTINVSRPSTPKSVTATSVLLSSSTISLTGSTGSAGNRTENQTTSSQMTPTTSPLSTRMDPASQTSPNETTLNASTATTSLSDAERQSLKYSEIILTSIFSAILFIVVLVIVAYSFKKCLGPRSQYSHQPLREMAYDSDPYSPPDDTLVISGGLYDSPRIYNPNMTVLEEEEPQNDLASFSSRSGQFRLEFLPGDKDLDPSFHRKHV